MEVDRTVSDVSLPAMRELQRLILRLSAGSDLQSTLRAVVDGVVEGLGFGVAVVNLVQDDGTVEVVTVAGPTEASEALLGQSSDVATWQAEIDRAKPLGQLRYLAFTEPDNEAITSWVPDIPVSDDPDAWHPLDALFAPLYSISGTLVGVLSVDLPSSGLRPDDVQRALLEMFATQAGIAIDNARLMSRVRASEESFRIAFENAPIGMSLVDFNPEDAGRFLRVNEAMARMTGHSRRHLETLSISDLTHPADRATDAEVVRRVMAGEIERYQLEKRYVHADGHHVWVSLQTSVVRDSEGTAVYGISQFEDIGDRRAEHQELTRRARIDPLTGLLNRSALTERVQNAVDAARRTGRLGAVLFCDLDAFKPVNDTLAHAFGDQVLAIIAHRLEAQVRTGDTIARFGGDEFVIVTEDLGDTEMLDLVERLQLAVSAPVDVGGVAVTLAVTVGRARVSGHRDETPDGLIAAADVDMYLRKPSAQGTRERKAEDPAR
jgi:diguanylate cyclase (GGDEF)-like protein/PAS domain S-box-containing protein